MSVARDAERRGCHVANPTFTRATRSSPWCTLFRSRLHVAPGTPRAFRSPSRPLHAAASSDRARTRSRTSSDIAHLGCGVLVSRAHLGTARFPEAQRAPGFAHRGRLSTWPARVAAFGASARSLVPRVTHRVDRVVRAVRLDARVVRIDFARSRRSRRDRSHASHARARAVRCAKRPSAWPRRVTSIGISHARFPRQHDGAQTRRAVQVPLGGHGDF